MGHEGRDVRALGIGPQRNRRLIKRQYGAGNASLTRLSMLGGRLLATIGRVLVEFRQVPEYWQRRREYMSKKLLLRLNRNATGEPPLWIRERTEEPRIAWYPSAGGDFRNVLFGRTIINRVSAGTGTEKLFLSVARAGGRIGGAITSMGMTR